MPSPDLVRQLLQKAADTIGQEDGLHLPGLRRALALQAAAYVDRAIDFLWNDVRQIVESYGAELEGSVQGQDLDGMSGILRFRADFAERLPDGRTRIIDWKSGRLTSKGVSATRLQGTAYAHAAGLNGDVVGLYGYLKPDGSDELPTLAVGSEENEPLMLLHFALRYGLSLWRSGLWFPILSTPAGRKPAACKQCEVKEACHQGDSGSKLRFENLVRAYAAENPNTSKLHAILNPIFEAQSVKQLKAMLTVGDPKKQGDEP
jgi:hypothetical protein